MNSLRLKAHDIGIGITPEYEPSVVNFECDSISCLSQGAQTMAEGCRQNRAARCSLQPHSGTLGRAVLARWREAFANLGSDRETAATIVIDISRGREQISHLHQPRPPRHGSWLLAAATPHRQQTAFDELLGGTTAPSARASTASFWTTWCAFHVASFGETAPVLALSPE